jgi:hypothetical protein
MILGGPVEGFKILYIPFMIIGFVVVYLSTLQK